MRRISRVIGTVVFGSGLTFGCATIGEATLVVPNERRLSCEAVCAGANAELDSQYRSVGEVLECVDGFYVQGSATTASATTTATTPPLQTGPGTPATPTIPVAICRMRTHYTGGVGRRPAGLVEPTGPREPESEIAALFAQMAHLEAASVVAFHGLARELEAHEAPRALCRAVNRAALDEVRHAAFASRWRDHFGGSALPLQVEAPAGARPLAEIARENAVEGCVRETWGAIVSTWAAAAAADHRIRPDLARIARDETRHAELAHAIARWARTRLGARARHDVRDAERGAIDELSRELDAMTSAPRATEAAARWLGLPGAYERATLLARARALVWQDAA